MYRPPQRAPKGAWARHLHAQRQARDLSQVQAFELVAERMRWSPKSRSAYVAIDMGDRQPKDFEAAVLAEEFGQPPAELEVAEAPDPYVVIANLTTALAGLTEELAAARLERATLAAKVERMGAVVEALARREMQGGEEPSLPDGRVG